MANITLPPPTATAAASDKSHTGKASTHKSGGVSFGSILAAQAADIPDAPPETTISNIPTDKFKPDLAAQFIANRKTDDAKKAIAPDTAAPAVTLIAPIIITTQAINQTIAQTTTPTPSASDKEVNKTSSNTTLMRDTQSNTLSRDTKQLAPSATKNEAIPIATKNILGDTKTFATDNPKFRTQLTDNIEHQLSAEPVTPQNIMAVPAQNFASHLPAIVANITPPSPQFSTPLGQSGWSEELSQKITWMTNSKQDQIAELQLNPPDLGPLNVVLKISENQASVMFSSPHASVREAVENSLPQLRTILADTGISLGNTTVSDQPQREANTNAFLQQQSRSSETSWHKPDADKDEINNLSITSVTPLKKHNGIVDTFA